MYVMLAAGGGAPSSFEPWLAISKEHYYRYNVFLLAPSMFICWILATGVVQLLARPLGGVGSFEDTAAALGVSVWVASWATLGHDLVMSFLSMVHVIDAAEHEVAMNSPTIFRTLIWTAMILYLVAFLVFFTRGIRSTQRLSLPKAALLGVVGFGVYQAMFFVFNR